MNQHRWQVSEMECDKCGSRQISVHPETCEYLECHVCHHMMPAPYIPPSQSVVKFTTEYRVTLWGALCKLGPKVSNHKTLDEALAFVDRLHPGLARDPVHGIETKRIDMIDPDAPYETALATIQADIVRVTE